MAESWDPQGEVHSWTDADRPPLMDETKPAITMTEAPPQGGGIGRGLAVGTTRATGTPFDIIQNELKPAVLDPVVNFLHNRLGIPTGPEIPIPTTEYQRNAFGVAPPQNREERIADAIGSGVGTAATYAPFGVGSALSAGAGATAASLSQEFFPDSLALQLLASGVGSLGTTLLARKLLLSGPIGGVTRGAESLTQTLLREYAGRAVGAGVGAALGVGAEHSILGAELGGIAGLLGGRALTPAIRYAASPVGIRNMAMGVVGGLTPMMEASRGREDWTNNLGPVYTNLQP